MYSHDGIRDSLTHLAAPTLLYEELRRELSRAKREQEPISVIRFILAPVDLSVHGVEIASYSAFEEDVVNFAQTLIFHSRDEDICARMGELEFVCILHGSEKASGSFISRISLKWLEVESSRHQLRNGNHVRLEVASLRSKIGESVLDLLNRLDRESTIAW